MPRVPVIDRILLWLFGSARNVFLLQGVAFGCAATATFAWTRSDVSPWMTRALVAAALISATFVAAGLLLSSMRSWSPRREGGSDAAGSVWPMALAASLVVIAGLSVAASTALPGLWRQILTQLSAIRFWEGLRAPSQFGGIVILPILLTLFVPLLVTAASLGSFVVPLVLLARLPFRPLMFPKLLSMGAACQGAFAATGWLAAALLRELSQVAAAAMSRAPDQDVRQLAAQLTAAVGTLTTASTMLLLPACALVGWAVFLRPAGRAAGYFDRAVELDAVELPNLEANYKAEPFVAFSAEAGEPAPLSRTWPGGYGGWALIALGVLMLLLAAMDSLRSRPAYVASVPIAGASLTTAPRTIQVTFSGALDPASTLSLVYVPAVPSENDISRDVGVTSRLAPGDAERRTLEVIPPRLSTGLYLVRWVAYSESGGVTRHGSFAFGLGVAVPADDRSDTYSLRERASGERGRRFTVLGGVLLLGMGALIWYRAGLTGS